MKWDDALGVWGVHGMGGLTGSLLIGIFAVAEVNGISGSVNQFFIQLLGVAIVVSYTCIVCWIILKVCDSFGKGIRTTEEAQERGLDSDYMMES